MKIETVLETVFIENFNTTALILENRIFVKLWDTRYCDRQSCFKYLYEFFPGRVQTSEAYKKANRCGENTAIESDPLLPYEKLYDDLFLYAVNKFGEKFKH